MQLANLYDTVLEEMDRILSILDSKVPSPEWTPLMSGKSNGYRYVDKTIHQAIIQKLVRTISGFRAVRLLMEYGFVQEQASLCRMLNELFEDIMFLTSAINFNDFTELHQEYLNAFYKEELDAETAMSSKQKRPMVPRKKILSDIHHKFVSNVHPNVTMEANRTINKIDSGFLHAASPQIMELYFGNPPKFHTHGVLGSVLHDDFRLNFNDYLFRSINGFACASKAFNEDNLYEDTKTLAYKFFQDSGMS